MQRRPTPGDRVTWRLPTSTRCVDCGTDLAVLGLGVRLDPEPSERGTVAVYVGVTSFQTKTRDGHPGVKYSLHATTCPKLTRRPAVPLPGLPITPPPTTRSSTVPAPNLECPKCGRPCANGTGLAAHLRHCKGQHDASEPATPTGEDASHGPTPTVTIDRAVPPCNVTISITLDVSDSVGKLEAVLARIRDLVVELGA